MAIYHKIIGEGFPIVMVHGWTLDHQAMMHAMEPNFKDRSGWKRIYIDLPGMGKSDALPSIRNSDDMLEAVLDITGRADSRSTLHRVRIFVWGIYGEGNRRGSTR